MLKHHTKEGGTVAVTRTTIYLGEKDRCALSLIQGRYGLATLSDAIRFSVRVVQGLAPPETAIAHHLPVRGGQRRARESGTVEALIAQARQSGHAAAHVIAQTKAFLDQRHPGRPEGGLEHRTAQAGL